MSAYPNVRPPTMSAPPNGPALQPRPALRDAPSLAGITTATRKLPSRLAVHAVQKWGKTSLAAQAPHPIFVCTRGEDGLMTLIDSGELPPTPHFPDPVTSWNHLLLALNELVVHDHPHRTLVLDTINGAERLAVEDVIRSRYENSYDKFDNYGRGGQRLLPHIVELTETLDRLRQKGMAVILLAHTVVKTLKNPDGLDYPRWEPPLFKETQEHLDRWCDGILFGKFETFVSAADPKATKGKATGGQSRFLMSEWHPTYSAGNRLGLPPEIPCGNGPAEAWANLLTALKNKKEKPQ